jgi:1-acyl-sn-glycerol-3-phosphate acyltransferase
MSYWILRALARLLISAQMRLRVVGAERVPRTGPVLLVSNHLGPADHFAVGVRLRRRLRILAKAEIFEWPLLGWLARRAGAVRIRRGESDREALRIASRLLESGECVLVFPEGTYAHPPDPVGMLPLKTGAAWLALRSGATIVPVGLSGIESVWVRRRGWRLFRRAHVTVAFGEPYRLPPALGATRKQTLETVTEEMALRIAALIPASYRGSYAGAVAPQTEAELPVSS